MKEKVKCHTTRIGLYLDGIGFNNAKEIEKLGFVNFICIITQKRSLSGALHNIIYKRYNVKFA